MGKLEDEETGIYYLKHRGNTTDDTTQWKHPKLFLLLKSKQKDTEGRKCAYDTERGRKKPKEKLNKESRKVVTNLKGLRERKEKEDEMGRLIYPPAERGGRPADWYNNTI